MGEAWFERKRHGYGLVYILIRDDTKAGGKSLEGARVVISGSGNVAIYCAEKVAQLGGLAVRP